MQNNFWAVLAQCMNCDLDYLQNLYYIYNRDVKIENISIPWLNENINDYLNYINISREGNKRDAIFKIYDTMFTNNFAK